MKNNKGFFSSLQKSTKVTILSCFSFIALTLLILIFFILFPITPSERIMASIGRETAFNNNQNDNNSVVTAAVSTAPPATSDIFEEEDGTRTTKTYKIVITTGSGFLWNGRVPDGLNDTKTTVVIYDDPKYPTVDPGYSYPTPAEPATEVPAENPGYPIETTPAEPEIPVVSEPIEPEIPVVTEPPVYIDPNNPPQTQPPIIIDPQPPVENPWVDPNAEVGDDVSEW